MMLKMPSFQLQRQSFPRAEDVFDSGGPSGRGTRKKINQVRKTLVK
jgi:hypothetical protein